MPVRQYNCLLYTQVDANVGKRQKIEAKKTLAGSIADQVEPKTRPIDDVGQILVHLLRAVNSWNGVGEAETTASC